MSIYRFLNKLGISLIIILSGSLAVKTYYNNIKIHNKSHKQSNNNALTTNPSLEQDTNPDLIIYGVKLQQFDLDGNLVKTILSQQVKHYTHQDKFYFKKTNIDILTSNQDHYLLQAQKTKSTKNFEKFLFSDHVKLFKQAKKPEDSFQLTTQSLIYLTKKDLAYTNSPLTITQDGHVVHADGMKASLKSNNLTLKHPKAEIKSDHAHL